MINDLGGLWWSHCWQLTTLILVVALLGTTVLRHRPHLLHLLWVIVFVKSLTLPLWSSPTSVFSWIETRRAVGAVEYGYTTPVPSSATATARPALTEPALASESPPVGQAGSATELFTAACAAWAVGVIVLLGFAIRRWIEVYRLLKRNCHVADRELADYTCRLAKDLKLSSRIRVRVSEANYGPMIFGSYRPVVILPEALASAKSLDELRPILAHELLHARRGDTTFGALQFLAQVVWWFHPLVWWASRQANRVCERCCDEEVIASLKCKPSEYVRCMLDALELKSRLSVVPALPGIRSVDITWKRLEHIMDNPQHGAQSAPRHHWIYAVVLALLVLPGGGLLIHAWQESTNIAPADERQLLIREAEMAAANQDWGLAAETFRKVTQRDPDDGRAWFMLGYCLHANGQLDEAIAAHQRAATFPRARRTALYNLACAYSLLADRSAAIETLRQAIHAGFVSPTPISDDPDFASLKNDPAFLELVEAARLPADRHVYRQFDFWIGEWDVFDRNDQHVGTNEITKDEKGFLLTEKWVNERGDTGTSISYYDPSDRQWKQTWVDSGGNIVQYRGGWSDGQMSLEGQLTKPDGEIVWSRVSYSLREDGSVRQFIERSSDDGQTWEVYFDGTYVRRETVDDGVDTLSALRMYGSMLLSP